MSHITSSNRVRQSGRLATVLDIGTTKTSCIMFGIENVHARPGSDGASVAVDILGAAHQRSQGIKAGVVADMDAVEATIKSVVGEVENQADLEVADLILSVSCGRLRSDNFRATTPLEGKCVSGDDIQRLTNAGRSYAERNGRVLVHTNRVSFSLDDERGIDDPVGMSGGKLAQELHMVSADAGPLKNLLLTAERSFFNVEGLVPSAYASADAVLSSEEKKLGVIAVDLGGGTSSFAVYADGHFIHIDSITLGGDHITYDIARALSTPLQEAERIKTLYGTVINASSDECEMVAYRSINDRGNRPQTISKASLGRIIRPRVEEILQRISERLAECQLSDYAGDRVVLTGGGCQLQGMAEFSAHFLGRSVRLGSPMMTENLPEGMHGPAFSSVIGQLRLTAAHGDDMNSGCQFGSVQNQTNGYLSNVGNWLRESF